MPVSLGVESPLESSVADTVHGVRDDYKVSKQLFFNIYDSVTAVRIKRILCPANNDNPCRPRTLFEPEAVTL